MTLLEEILRETYDVGQDVIYIPVSRWTAIRELQYRARRMRRNDDRLIRSIQQSMRAAGIDVSYGTIASEVERYNASVE